MSLTGHGMTVSSYILKVTGDIQGNADYQVDIYNDQMNTLPTLASFPIAPAFVPDLFNFGPEFQAKGVIFVHLDGQLRVRFG